MAADLTIDQMIPATIPLSGTEQIPLILNPATGTNYKVNVENLTKNRQILYMNTTYNSINNISPTSADSGTIYYNSTAGVPITVTLPDTSVSSGTTYSFVIIDAFTVTLESSTNPAVIYFGDISGTSLSSSTVGNFITLKTIASGIWVATGATGTGWNLV